MPLDVLGPLLLVAVVFLKEAGLPIPVPGDLLVIGAGIAAAQGLLPAGPIVAAIVIASVAGGSIQFLLLRGRARAAMVRGLARVGIRTERLERQAGRLRQAGAVGVALARATPGVRVAAVAASALAALPFAPFITGLAAGNTVFIGGHFALGLVVGEPAVRLAGSLGLAIAVVVAVLAIVGAAAWWWRSRSGRPGAPLAVDRSGYASWSDATCPACLALAVLEGRHAAAPGSD